ncbi:ABC transporter permease [Terrilactibacillus sp. S3-3]|nr:ABC transporter permease [Terrilactibacillus sp. S3-3]
MIADIFCSTIKQNLRDRKSLIMMLLFPIVLTLILGTALGKVMGGSHAAESLHVKAAIVNDDHGAAAKSMVQFFQSEKIKKIVSSKNDITEKRARADLKGQKLDAIIVIPGGFSNQVASGRPAHVDFVTSGDLEATVVKSIADSYLKRVSAVQSTAEMGASPKAAASARLDSLLSDHALSIKGKVRKRSIITR